MWRKLVKQMGASPLKSTTLILLVFAALAVGAGAAVGVVMRGELDAKIPITVSQALIGDKPEPHNFPPGRKFFSSTSDDHTKFSIALEMYRGESLTVLVPIVNRSSGDTVAEFSMVMPDIPTLIEGEPGLTVELAGSGRIDDVVRVTPDTWTFTAKTGSAGSSATPPDGLLMTFTIAKTAMSGFFEIAGRIRTVEF